MKIDFYFWSYQCPLNCEMIQLLMEYRKRLDIHLYDISEEPDLARKMFYPTLTVVEERYRFFAPLRRSFMEELCTGHIPDENPYRPGLGMEERVCDLIPITEVNCERAGQCTGKKCVETCAQKAEFYKTIGINVWGYMNLCGEKMLAESYNKVIVVSDETGVFPNGDMEFFARNDYRDLGILAREENYCTLHLMEKMLDVK